MRTRILTSLIIIALASALAGGATYAVFTHREEIEGNIISTGNLEFTLVGEPFNVTDMKPGDIVEGYIEIANTGTLDMIFRASIEQEGTTTDGFTDQLLVSVILNPAGYVSQGYDHYGRYGPPNALICNKVPLTHLITSGLDNESATFDDGYPLEPGYVAIYKVEIELPFDTGSEWEGATFQGDLVVEGTQADNQTPGSVVY